MYILIVRSLIGLDDFDFTLLNTQLRMLSIIPGLFEGRWPEGTNEGLEPSSGSHTTTHFTRLPVDVIFPIPNPPIIGELISRYHHIIEQMIVDLFHQISASRCFFRLDNGYTGIGTAGMKTGDHVCAFANKSGTIVLRKMGSEWLNVGPCYVLGLPNPTRNGEEQLRLTRLIFGSFASGELDSSRRFTSRVSNRI